MVDVLAGYETGPDATLRATAAAWELVGDARIVVLVEGVSDQIAVDSAAAALNCDLASAGIVVVPMGGAHAIGRALTRLDEQAPDAVIGCLYDVDEDPFIRRALTAAGRSDALDRTALEALGFFACIDDLEDELVRAAGRDLIERVLVEQGDHAAFAMLRAQPAWHDRPWDAQIRRFFGAGARRKHRYAAALVEAIPPDRLPTCLVELLTHVRDA